MVEDHPNVSRSSGAAVIRASMFRILELSLQLENSSRALTAEMTPFSELEKLPLLGLPAFQFQRGSDWLKPRYILS